MVQIFTEKYPELPALFLSYCGLWKTIDFLSDASSWASNAHSSSPKCFAQRCLNIWLIRLCASMISIEIQDRKYPFGHSTQPSALWNCSLSLYTLLTVLFSPVINYSDNEFPWKTAHHQWPPLLWTGTGITSNYKKEDFNMICTKENRGSSPQKAMNLLQEPMFRSKKAPTLNKRV